MRWTNWRKKMVEDDFDGIKAAKGILYGTALGALSWLVVGLVVYFISN